MAVDEMGIETGIGDGGKSNCYGDKVEGQETASRAMVRAVVTRWRGPPRRQRLTSGAAGDNDRLWPSESMFTLRLVGQKPVPRCES